MKLKRLQTATTKEGRYSITLHGYLNSDLNDYVTAYKEAYPDDPVTPDLLIPAIIAQFLASDSAFQSWKKERAGETATTRQRRRKDGHNVSSETLNP